MFLSRTATSMKFVCKGVCVRTALILAQLTCLSSTSLPPNVEALPPRTGSLITVLHQREYHSPTPDDSNLLSSVRLPLALKGGGVAPKKSSQRKDTVLTFEAASEHCSGQSLLVVGMGLRTIHSGVSQLEGRLHAGAKHALCTMPGLDLVHDASRHQQARPKQQLAVRPGPLALRARALRRCPALTARVVLPGWCS
eukprot:3885367-Rhodomonas_salina.1